MKSIRFSHIFAWPLLLAAFMFASCDLVGSIGDIEPKYVLTDNTVINDEATAEHNLNGVYASLRSQSIFWFRHYMDMLTGTESETNIDGLEGFKENNVLETNDGVSANYLALYGVINEATSFIYNVSKSGVNGISDVRKKEMIGEAHFLRALAYFYLLRQYGEFYDLDSEYGIVCTGDVPIRMSRPIARSSVKDSYATIISDLDDAIANAPDVALHYRVSRTAAKALKARVMLYMQDYKSAGDLAQQVIDESADAGYSLGEDYRTMFAQGHDMEEGLFVLYTSYPNEVDVDANWDVSPGAKLQGLAVSLTGDGSTDRRFTEIFVNEDPDESWIMNYKYPNNSMDTEVSENTYFFIRLSEMYYILAEAEARQGNLAGARTALKQIICLPRTGYASEYVDEISNADFLLVVLQQKWMELATESNEEWYDLVRYHVADGLAIAPTYVSSDAHLTMPIPRTAMAGNNLLKQNPSYTTR